MKKSRKRNRRGGGSVFKDASGQWWASLSRTVSGHRKQQRQRVNSYAAGCTALEKMRATSVLPPESSVMLVGDWMDRWLDEVAESFAPSTHALYETTIRHAEPLRTRLVNRVRPADIQAVITEVPPSRTRELLFVALRLCFRRAVELGVIAHDPTTNIARPKHESEEPQPFTADEVKQILDASKEHRLGGVIALGLICGLRIGECLALEWNHWQDDELQIAQSVRVVKGKANIAQVKTRASRRRVPLLPTVIDRLQIRQRFRLKEGLASSPLIFPTRNGTITVRDNFRQNVWNKILEQLGIRHRGFHHARHTAATSMLSAGVPVHAVSRVLGHAKASTTLDIYAHWIPSNDAQVREGMRRIGS